MGFDWSDLRRKWGDGGDTVVGGTILVLGEFKKDGGDGGGDNFGGDLY